MPQAAVILPDRVGRPGRSGTPAGCRCMPAVTVFWGDRGRNGSGMTEGKGLTRVSVPSKGLFMSRRIRSAPRARQAHAFLVGLVSGAPQGARLPTIAQCAREAGVSKATMSKAVALLVEQGVLRASPGRGLTVSEVNTLPAAHHPDANRDLDCRAAWERVRDALLDDMVTGVLSPGAVLPPCKELCRRYDTGYATLRRALGGIPLLHRTGRRYRVGTPHGSAASLPIIAVAESDSIARMATHSPRAQQFWQSLERECHERRVAFELRDARSFTRKSGRAAGYLLLTQGLTDDRIRRAVKQTRLPLAMYDEAGRSLSALVPAPGGKVAIFAHTDNRRSGSTIAQYLLGMGHRHIACIRRAPGVRWSDERVGGIQEAFAQVGLQSGVTTVVVEERGMWEQYTSLLPRSGATPPCNATARKMLSCLTPAQRRAMPDLERRILFSMFTYEEHRLLLPVFERLRATPSITAWVGVHDRLALSALAFVQREYPSSRRRPSVIGFDNTLAAFTNGLTSYDYNATAVASAMVRYVLGDPVFALDKRRHRYTVGGTLVVRGSSMPPSR